MAAAEFGDSRMNRKVLEAPTATNQIQIVREGKDTKTQTSRDEKV